MTCRVSVELSHQDESLRKEVTVTENVSPRDTRVVTEREWQPGTNVLVTSPEDGVRDRSQIVLLSALSEGQGHQGFVKTAARATSRHAESRENCACETARWSRR